MSSKVGERAGPLTSTQNLRNELKKIATIADDSEHPAGNTLNIRQIADELYGNPGNTPNSSLRPWRTKPL